MTDGKPSTHAVHIVRRSLTFEGGSTGAPTAVCPRRLTAISVERCGPCPHFAGLVIKPEEQAHLRCAFELPLAGEPVPSLGCAADAMKLIHLVATLDSELDDVEALLVDDVALPVVDAVRQPIGLVTKASLSEPRTPGAPTRIADVALEPAFSVGPDAPIGYVAAIMAHERVDHVLVVDDEKLVGTISLRDVARWLACRSGYVVPSKE